MAPGNDTHGLLQAEIGALRVTTAGAGQCLPRGDQARDRSPGPCQRNYRVPDLGVTRAPPSRDSMLPEPGLLLEILSASNEAESWANIWTYISIPSVTEILAVNSTRIEAELLRRQADGSWPRDRSSLVPTER